MHDTNNDPTPADGDKQIADAPMERFLDLKTIGDGTVLERIKRGETVTLVYEDDNWTIFSE